jgi:DHA1 family multidrug/chloramphenicol efflux transport protein-like MFS transporter
MSEPLIPITRRQAVLFAGFLVFYEFLTYIANDMIMPGMINVVKSFNAPETMVATSLTVYILGGASLQIILGPLSDSYGRRPMMLTGSGLFLIFTLFIACSNSMEQFLAARFFQGMGLCFIGVIGYATIQEIFEEMDAVRLIAIMANAAILAPLLGPLIGAVIIHFATWRLIFIMIAGLAVLALWGLWRFMPEPIGQTKRDGQVIAKANFSAKVMMANYKAILTNPKFCFSALATGFIGIPCISWIAIAPIILIAEAKLSVIDYALWQLPVFGATILGNWFLHKLTYKYKLEQIIYFGSILIVVGLVLAALLPYLYGNNYKLILPGVILYFFALSILNAPLNRYCLFVTAVSKGTASAVVSLSVMIIGALGIEVANEFYESHDNLHLALYWNLVAAIALLFIGLTFLTKKKVNVK